MVSTSSSPLNPLSGEHPRTVCNSTTEVIEACSSDNNNSAINSHTMGIIPRMLHRLVGRRAFVVQPPQSDNRFIASWGFCPPLMLFLQFPFVHLIEMHIWNTIRALASGGSRGSSVDNGPPPLWMSSRCVKAAPLLPCWLLQPATAREYLWLTNCLDMGRINLKRFRKREDSGCGSQGGGGGEANPRPPPKSP